jgi:hypothetical protein
VVENPAQENAVTDSALTILATARISRARDFRCFDFLSAAECYADEHNERERYDEDRRFSR